MPINDPVGQGLAGALIAVATFRTLIEKGVLTEAEGNAVIDRAIAAVKDSTLPEDRRASDILADLRRQLHS